MAKKEKKDKEEKVKKQKKTKNKIKEEKQVIQETKEPVKQEELVQKLIPKPDKLPNINSFLKVVVYGWQIGYNAYRFGIKKPFGNKVLFQKEMTGSEAKRFLRGIQNKNKYKKLESRFIPKN